MCPYARFQSAMFDEDTLIISYDGQRGEPRGARRRGTDARGLGLGDCIDCTLCVQACPTGIDIRHGLQYECIACGACIDACNEVMDKMGTPRGLIRYTTGHALQGKPRRIVRARLVVYAALISAALGALGFSLLMRTPLILDVIRDRNALYRETHGDRIENAYTLKMINLDDRPHSYRLSASGLRGLELIAPAGEIRLPPGSVNSVAARLEVPRELAGGVHPIVLTLAASDGSGIAVHENARFIGPTP
jgi:cytochrome c oxidase accessory protein FixG